MIDPERIQRLAEKLGNREDALEFVRQMRCGGKKFEEGGPEGKPLFDKKKVADRIPADGGYPGGTSGIVDAVRHYLANDDNYVGDRIKDAMDDARSGKLDSESLSQMLAHEDAKRIYLGMPQVYGSFEPSPYRPTVGSMDNPYQLNGLLSDSSFENTILPMYATWKTGKDWPLYDTASRVTNLGKTAQLSDFPYLHRAGMSEGFDNNGQYISLQDTWDYNTAVKGKSGDNISKWVGGKPFDIYQRYYLDDWLDIPDGAKGNPYIAPSYIEADYTGPRYTPDYTFWGLPKERGEWDSTVEFGCGGKMYPGGGKFLRTNLEGETPLMYNPIPPTNYPIEVPLRFRPQPDLGDYEYPVSTGMLEGYPVSFELGVPAPGYSVTVPEEVPTVSLLDPKKDAARRIMAVENSKDNVNGGWDAKSGRWYPHKSYEGGADTIAYGIKLSNGTPEAALALKQGYLTDEQAISAVDTLVQKYYDAAKKVYDGKYGDGEWDKLSDKSQSILVDYSYNPGLAKFPNLMEGFHSGNLDLIRKNYKRYSNGKELGRNKVLLEELDTLGNEYPIFRGEGGSIHIKPSHRGRLTELKARTGKSEAELYNDGNPAHKKMVVFARNARKWNHADGGHMNRYDGETENSNQMERIPFWQRMVQIGSMNEAPAVMTAAGMEVNPDGTITYGNDSEGVRQLRANLPVIGATGLTGFLGGSGLLSNFGRSVSTGIDMMGRASMPSTLLKGIASYAPRFARTATMLSPYADAAALTAYSAYPVKEMLDARAQGRTADAIGWGSLAALPVAGPVIGSAAQGIRNFRNSFRLSPFEATDLTALGPVLAQPEVTIPSAAKATRAVAPYEIESLSGDMLKPLMRGSTLEKQLAKDGTISVNSIRALAEKSAKVDKDVIETVLSSEKFAGKNKIDYNEFRRAVQDELITWNRHLDTRYEDYGLDRIGYSSGADARASVMFKSLAGIKDVKNEKGVWEMVDSDGNVIPQEKFDEMLRDWVAKFDVSPRTFVFDTPRIKTGNHRHYNENTQAHSRSFTTNEDPDVMYFLEAQSDKAQGNIPDVNLANNHERRKNYLKQLDKLLSMYDEGEFPESDFLSREDILKQKVDLENTLRTDEKFIPKPENIQDEYLMKNYESRLIKENLKIAAEKGKKKMRYPTPETAANIEGYEKSDVLTGEELDAKDRVAAISLAKEIVGRKLPARPDIVPIGKAGAGKTYAHYSVFNGRSDIAMNADGSLKHVPVGEGMDYRDVWKYFDAIERKLGLVDVNPEYLDFAAKDKEVMDMYRSLEDMQKSIGDNIKKIPYSERTFDYSDKVKTILKKYADFPKKYKKIFNDVDVRTVTDSHGNTWYEVDVPDNYLESEIAFKNGGIIERYSKDSIKTAIANIRAKMKK